MIPALSSLRLVGPLLCLATLPWVGDLKLKEADHKKLGDLVGTYFKAEDEEKGIAEAKQKVLDQIESTEKRLKGAKLLASVGDWEQVFRMVTQERLKETTLKKKGEVAETKLKSERGLEVSIAYSAPKKPSKDPLPLVLIACDDGEAPSAHLNTHWNDPVVRESALLVAFDLGKDTKSWGVFGSPKSPGGAFTVITTFFLIRRQVAIDPNRVFLVGSGKGFAATEVAAAYMPDVFAGLIGIGDVAVADPAFLENFRSVPTLFLKGGEGATAIEAKLKELGFGNCKLDPEGAVTAAWEWIGKSGRVAYPAQISFSPKDDSLRKVHWLFLDGMQAAENPRVEAKADKATNTITIDATKVGQVMVYLNDEIVDLEKPVKFVINGVVHEQTVARSAPEMMRRFYGDPGDWGRVFTASVSLDVTTK